MNTYRVTIHDPRTTRTRMFWVSMLEQDIDAESEELAILRCLHDFCQRGGISLLESGRMHVTCELTTNNDPILIQDGGHA